MSTFPKLRFPDFTDIWQTEMLSDISDFQEGPGILAVDFKARGVPLIRLSGLAGDIVSLEGCNYLDEEKVRQKWSHFKLKKGDLLISTSATFGIICEVDQRTEGSIAYTGIIRFRPNIEKMTKDYLKHILTTEKFINQTKAMSTGATIHHFGPSHLKQISLSIPSKSEQQKIAYFLTAVDEKIASVDKKVELLKQYKKGVMQKIFTQQIRFKDEDGQDYPEWDEKLLSEVTERITKRNKDDTIKNVLTNSAVQGIVSQNDFFEKNIANQNNLANYYIVSSDDFVYNPRISAHAPVGPIKRNHLSIGVMSPLYSVFRFKKGVLDFYEKYFETKYWHDYMKSVANSGARHDRMNITNTDLYDLPLPFPRIDEQQKIANFLSAIDDKIKAEEIKRTSAKKFKKALLQRMFV